MSGPKEVKEVKDVDGAKERNHRVAAFFDLDGTLVALPSLERRFFGILRYRREISARSYFLWLREALRLMPRGMDATLHANKMYLRGVQILDERGERDEEVSSWHKAGHQARGQASAPPRSNPRLPVPRFFGKAIERVAWHARQGHQIALLSGTLEPLARATVQTMGAGLELLGITVKIHVGATRLETMGGKWTGRILGDAMFGEAKAREARRLAEELQLNLKQCYAYGDSSNDRWLLAMVGKPAAVNPSNDLASIARARGWPVLHWKGKSGAEAQGSRGNGTAERTLQGACLALRRCDPNAND